jgi:hypothetical protein
MNIFQKIFYFFSSNTDPSERRVAKFFAKLDEHQTKDDIKQDLDWFLQNNIIGINLWSEFKYRGYKYLKKAKRRELYNNSLAIASSFEVYLAQNKHSLEQIVTEISAAGVDSKNHAEHAEQLQYLRSIMSYLSPHAGRYKYRKSCTFGELLKDPNKDVLVGDCNQIVTLYMYLYSLSYDVSSLQIKTYPGHVALHFMGVDIEATNGTFANYKESGQAILPAEEIVSVNLLDVTDEYFKTHDVSTESLLESARIAYILSSQREIVEKNLAAAYNNVVVDFCGSSNYAKALKYAKQSEEPKLIHMAGHNGAIFFMRENEFKKALNFAEYSNDKTKLYKSIYHNKGAYYFSKEDYYTALRAFEQIGEHEAVKNCYAGLFTQEQKKLGKLDTAEDIKANRKIIGNMQTYANSSGNASMIKYVSSLNKYL